jgi:hypothetical protein
MDQLKPILVASLTAIVVTVVGISMLNAPQGPAGQNGRDGITVGGDYSARTDINVGGVRTEYRHTESLNSATTSPIAIQAPSATSTLQVGSGCYISTSSTTAKTLRFAKASTPNSTTTFLFGVNIAANGYADAYSTTSADSFTFGPNQWLVGSFVGGSGVDSPAGRCDVAFMVH